MGRVKHGRGLVEKENAVPCKWLPCGGHSIPRLHTVCLADWGLEMMEVLMMVVVVYFLVVKEQLEGLESALLGMDQPFSTRLPK